MISIIAVATLTTPLALFLTGGDEEKGPASPPPAIEEARSLFRTRSAAEAAEGAELCLAMGGADAAQLLLEVFSWREGRERELVSRRFGNLRLDRSEPLTPVREVAWTALLKLTGPEVHAAYAAQLDHQGADPIAQVAAIRLLERAGARDHAPALALALDDKEFGVRRAAARALATLGGAAELTALERAAEDDDPYTRANAIRSLVHIQGEGAREHLVRGLADGDASVRCALLDVLADLDVAAAVGHALACASDPDWRVRVRAVEVLAASGTSEGVDGLIAALSDPRRYVSFRATELLRSVTGRGLASADHWRKWWKAAREGFTFPETGREELEGFERPKAFHIADLVIDSDHIGFLIDTSEVMTAPSPAGPPGEEEAEPTDEDLPEEGSLDPDETDEEEGESESTGPVERRETFYLEFEASTSRLYGRASVQAWALREEPVAFVAEPTPVDLASRHELLAFTRRELERGRCDLWEGLQAALFHGGVDTLVLALGGAPNDGEIGDLGRIREELADLRRFHPVRVYAVSLDDDPAFLEGLDALCRSTGGRATMLR